MRKVTYKEIVLDLKNHFKISGFLGSVLWLSAIVTSIVGVTNLISLVLYLLSFMCGIHWFINDDSLHPDIAITDEWPE